MIGEARKSGLFTAKEGITQRVMHRNVFKRAALCVVVLAAVLATGAWAQAGAIAKVDVEKINKEYKLASRYQDELQRYRTELEAEFQGFLDSAYLTSEELAELNQLREKNTPSASESARIKELAEYTKTKRDRLIALDQKPEDQLTDAEKAEMAQLRQKETEATKNANAKYDDLMRKLTTRQQEYAAEIEKNVTAALEQVCSDKNLTAVFSGEVILYGGVDITDDVLSKLNVE